MEGTQVGQVVYSSNPKKAISSVMRNSALRPSSRGKQSRQGSSQWSASSQPQKQKESNDSGETFRTPASVRFMDNSSLSPISVHYIDQGKGFSPTKRGADSSSPSRYRHPTDPHFVSPHDETIPHTEQSASGYFMYPGDMSTPQMERANQSAASPLSPSHLRTDAPNPLSQSAPAAFTKKLADKVRQQARELSSQASEIGSLKSYAVLCEERIRQFDPSHSLPLTEASLSEPLRTRSPSPKASKRHFSPGPEPLTPSYHQHGVASQTRKHVNSAALLSPHAASTNAQLLSVNAQLRKMISEQKDTERRLERQLDGANMRCDSYRKVIKELRCANEASEKDYTTTRKRADILANALNELENSTKSSGQYTQRLEALVAVGDRPELDMNRKCAHLTKQVDELSTMNQQLVTELEDANTTNAEQRSYISVLKNALALKAEELGIPEDNVLEKIAELQESVERVQKESNSRLLMIKRYERGQQEGNPLPSPQHLRQVEELEKSLQDMQEDKRKLEEIVQRQQEQILVLEMENVPEETKETEIQHLRFQVGKQKDELTKSQMKAEELEKEERLLKAESEEQSAMQAELIATVRKLKNDVASLQSKDGSLRAKIEVQEREAKDKDQKIRQLEEKLVAATASPKKSPRAVREQEAKDRHTENLQKQLDERVQYVDHLKNDIRTLHSRLENVEHLRYEEWRSKQQEQSTLMEKLQQKQTLVDELLNNLAQMKDKEKDSESYIETLKDQLGKHVRAHGGSKSPHESQTQTQTQTQTHTHTHRSPLSHTQTHRSTPTDLAALKMRIAEEQARASDDDDVDTNQGVLQQRPQTSRHDTPTDFEALKKRIAEEEARASDDEGEAADTASNQAPSDLDVLRKAIQRESELASSDSEDDGGDAGFVQHDIGHADDDDNILEWNLH